MNKNEDPLLARLNQYIKNRTDNKKEYFTIFSKFFKGYSKTEKLQAAEILKDIMNGKIVSIDDKTSKVLHEGDLGKITKDWEKVKGKISVKPSMPLPRPE